MSLDALRERVKGLMPQARADLAWESAPFELTERNGAGTAGAPPIARGTSETRSPT